MNDSTGLEFITDALHQEGFQSSRAQLSDWLSGGSLMVVEAGNSMAVTSDDDCAYFVLFGCMVLFTGPLEHNIAIPMFQAMCINGYVQNKERATFGETRYLAACKTWLWKMPRDRFEEGLNDVRIQRDLFTWRLNELAHTRALCVLHSQGKLKRKLAQFLVVVAQLSGFRGKNYLEIRIKQEYIARIAGLTRPYVTKGLKELTDEGILKTEYGRIMVLDEPALIARAELPNYPADAVPVVFDSRRLESC